MLATVGLWTRSALLVVAVWYASWALLLGIYTASDAVCPAVDVPCSAQYWIQNASVMVISAAAAVGSLISAYAAARQPTGLQLALWFLVLMGCALSTGSATWSWSPVAVGLPVGLLTLRWLWCKGGDPTQALRTVR